MWFKNLTASDDGMRVLGMLRAILLSSAASSQSSIYRFSERLA